MRSIIIVTCVLAQAFALAYMVYDREAIIKSGTAISISTAPIDPRDPFRGDFVRLRYGLNSLDYAPTQWIPADWQARKGDKIYAVLQARTGGLYDVAYFTNVKPDSTSETLFIRGRLRTNLADGGRNQINVTYGIEQLFVEQGLGIDIEERQGVRGGLQTAMLAQLYVDSKGTAVLTGYDWSPLSIGIELTDNFMLKRNETNNLSSEQTTTDSLPALRLTIANQSDADITLNNPGDNCGFQLEPANRVSSDYVVPEGSCTGLTAKPVTLAAGQSLSIDVDLATPRWQMSLAADKGIMTGDIRSFVDNGEWFRLVYRPASLPSGNAEGFWQGELVSQAFNALGRVD